MGFRARVENGRIHLDEPTELPEGTELDLVIDDGGDDLDPEDRAALNRALDESWKEVEAGHVRPAWEVIEELRSRR